MVGGGSRVTIDGDDDVDLEEGEISQREAARREEESRAGAARIQAAIGDPALLARLLAALPQ